MSNTGFLKTGLILFKKALQALPLGYNNHVRVRAGTFYVIYVLLKCTSIQFQSHISGLGSFEIAVYLHVHVSGYHRRFSLMRVQCPKLRIMAHTTSL